MSLHTLPTDVFLHIVARLTLLDIYHLRCTCIEAHRAVGSLEEPIYHQAALLHRFAKPAVSLADAIRIHGTWLSGSRTWKEYCRRWTALERNMNGRGFIPLSDPVKSRAAPSTTSNIRRSTSAGAVPIYASI
ncbi:hypothetical protein C8Q77DRAFT_432471 [Trametes polyzona]|nr:hypothetical protein C8Q77DRAFT_432471 [Trametes polyzona]